MNDFPDGYAVWLDDKNNPPRNGWFVGAYMSKEIADDVAVRTSSRVIAFKFFEGVHSVMDGDGLVSYPDTSPPASAAKD